MRKNVKNEKVLRAISIGLAAMVTATSAPVAVLADTPDGGGNTQNNNEFIENEAFDNSEIAEAKSEAEEIVKDYTETEKAVSDVIEDNQAATVLSTVDDNDKVTGSLEERQAVDNIKSDLENADKFTVAAN